MSLCCPIDGGDVPSRHRNFLRRFCKRIPDALDTIEPLGITVSVIGLGSESDSDAAFLKDIAAQNEIVFLFLDDPAEFSFTSWLGRLLGQWPGYLRMTDIETGREAIVPFRQMKKIEQEIRAERKRVRNHIKDLGIDSMVLEYSDSGKHFQRLYRFLLHRQEMIKSGGITIQ